MRNARESTEDYKARLRENPTPTGELISAAQEAFPFREEDDFDLSQKYWGPIHILHCRADDEVISFGAGLLQSEDKQSRILGANILSEVAFGDPAKGDAAGELLAAALETEQDSEVITDLAYALGHTPYLRASRRLIALGMHPSEDVRLAVAYALPMHSEDPAMIPALITLSKDQDADVRDWATFGLGSLLDFDLPDIRNALVDRLDDPHHDSRGEAIVGLAKRGDTRVIPALLMELPSDAPERLREWSLLVEAAEESVSSAEKSGDPKWLPLLARIQNVQLVEASKVAAGIQRCEQS
jgi:hypothetical protein